MLGAIFLFLLITFSVFLSARWSLRNKKYVLGMVKPVAQIFVSAVLALVFILLIVAIF